MLASTRERRANAGGKMAQLMESMEDCDDFYKQTYGGFEELQDDAGFESPAGSESDYIDSDFDDDEGEEALEDDEEVVEEATSSTAKRQASSKAYKEPTYKPKQTPVLSKKVAIKKEEKLSKPEVAIVRTRNLVAKPTVVIKEKKLRASTIHKSAASERRRVDHESEKRRRAANAAPKVVHRRLTQEEILAESKQTEKANLKSLARYQQYELEMERKRRAKLVKRRTIDGPTIRYHSTTMPVVREAAIAAPGDQTTGTVLTDLQPELGSKQSRNFITFSDDRTFYDTFSGAKRVALGFQAGLKPKPRSYCVVTGFPAKYFDPVTKQPYATLEAFRVLRSAYYHHVKERGDQNDPKVRAWLESNAPDAASPVGENCQH